MSTRCTIRIYNQDGTIRSQYYKHMDGYPEGVGEFIRRALAAVAQGYRLCSNCTTAEAFDKLLSIYPQFEKESPDIVHGDIEYYYAIKFFNADSKAIYKCIPVPESCFLSERMHEFLALNPFGEVVNG